MQGEPTLDQEGNVYFTHHYYDNNTKLEADIYIDWDEVKMVLIKRARVACGTVPNALETAETLWMPPSGCQNTALSSSLSKAFPPMMKLVNKPYPDTLNLILQQFGVKKEEAVFIGNSNFDTRADKGARIRLQPFYSFSILSISNGPIAQR